MKRYEKLDEAMCRELEKLDRKYGGGNAEMTPQDVELADKLYHALKCGETFYAMKEAGEWDEDEGEGSGEGRSYRGRSYARRGRDAMGRYTSRDMGRPEGSGYYGYSGHYPEWMPPYRY